MDATSEGRLTLICPQLADKVRQMASTLAQESIVIRVVQGLRSVAEQDSLYAMGRTAPGKIVTNCRGGYSYHNFGMAVDCVPSIGSTELAYQPDWNPQHPAWKRMIDAGKAVGLVSGSDWRTFPDFPHFQLNGRFPIGAPDDEVRQIWKDAGMEAVWQDAGI